MARRVVVAAGVLTVLVPVLRPGAGRGAIFVDLGGVAGLERSAGFSLVVGVLVTAGREGAGGVGTADGRWVGAGCRRFSSSCSRRVFSSSLFLAS